MRTANNIINKQNTQIKQIVNQIVKLIVAYDVKVHVVKAQHVEVQIETQIEAGIKILLMNTTKML